MRRPVCRTRWGMKATSSSACQPAMLLLWCVQVKQLKHASQCLEQEVRALKRRGRELEAAVQERVSGEVVERLKERHAEELEELKGKLKGDADKQKRVDEAMERLRAKEVEIESMKGRLVELEAARSKSARSKPARSSEARRIKHLESHVRELEKVIQKRFPNSLSALILAANSSTEMEMEAQ